MRRRYATLAIIMDGNGRWATKRHLPRLAGHKAGVTALRRVVECAADENIEMLSVYAFSTENWGRPRTEVDGLMRLFWETIRSDLEKLHRDGVRLRHLGRLQDLSSEIQKAVQASWNSRATIPALASMFALTTVGGRNLWTPFARLSLMAVSLIALRKS